MTPDVAWLWAMVCQAACCEQGKDWMRLAEFREMQLRDVHRAMKEETHATP